MRMAAIMGMVGLGVSACVAPQGGTAVSSAAGSYPVTVDGAAYTVDIRPGPAGQQLTRVGAVPVPGRTVTVARDGSAMGYDEGLPAKKAAVEACGSAGGRVNDGAVAQFASGTWVFKGGCA